ARRLEPGLEAVPVNLGLDAGKYEIPDARRHDAMPQGIRSLADWKLCRYVLFTPAASPGPIFRLLAGVVVSKVAAIRPFRGDRVCSRTIFHSVFHRCGKLGGTNRMHMESFTPA